MQTRPALIKVAVETARRLDPKIQFVISEGNPRGKSYPSRIGKLAGIMNGVQYGMRYLPRATFSCYEVGMLRCPRHSSLVSRLLLCLSKIMENNWVIAPRLRRLGAGVMLQPKGLGPERLGEAIEEILSNPEYKKKAVGLQKLADKLNGIENIVQIIRSYL